MSRRLVALLLSLPVLSVGVASAFAGEQSEAQTAPALSAPAQDHAAMPAGCNGCAGHACASCPLAMAAAGTQTPAPAAPPAIPCGTN